MKKMDSSLEWELGLAVELDERIGLAATQPEVARATQNIIEAATHSRGQPAATTGNLSELTEARSIGRNPMK
jgi:hypothetical protein